MSLVINVESNRIETLRFLCLNERKVSLVAICASILACKGSAAKRHLAPTRDAPGLSEHHQRVAISFSQWSSNH